jgi:signal transduction histidine kinase
VPCAICGAAATVGRVDVEDHTGMGVRVLEVVYGGHAHDLRQPHHDVVLVRDVTEQLRKQVLNVLEERMSTVEELASGLAAQVEGPLKGLLRHLSQAGTTADEETANAIKKAQFDAIMLRDAVVGFRVMGAGLPGGTADAAIACRHAVQLVQHRIGRRTELVTRHGEDLTVRVDGAALTQVVFSLLSDAVEACRGDRGRHHILIASTVEADSVWIEITDDRDPRSVPNEIVARTVARERVVALGATLEMFRTGGKHVARVQLKSVA